MVITATTTQVRNVFTAVLETELSSLEQSFTAAYGEPQVDAGGTITYGEATFTLPTNLRYLRSGFPTSFSVDGNSDEDAKDKVAGWVTTVSTRLTSAKTTLMDRTAPVSPSITVTQV